MGLKRFVLCLFLFGLVVSSLYSAHAALPDEVPFAEQTEKAGNFIEEKKWEYIGQQWKELL